MRFCELSARSGEVEHQPYYPISPTHLLVNKPILISNSVSNTFNIKSEFTADARNKKNVSFCKQIKIKVVQLRKTLLDQVMKKDGQYQEWQ